MMLQLQWVLVRLVPRTGEAPPEGVATVHVTSSIDQDQQFVLVMPSMKQTPNAITPFCTARHTHTVDGRWRIRNRAANLERHFVRFRDSR